VNPPTYLLTNLVDIGLIPFFTVGIELTTLVGIRVFGLDLSDRQAGWLETFDICNYFVCVGVVLYFASQAILFGYLSGKV